jgi:hypothetical protein
VNGKLTLPNPNFFFLIGTLAAECSDTDMVEGASRAMKKERKAGKAELVPLLLSLSRAKSGGRIGDIKFLE